MPVLTCSCGRPTRDDAYLCDTCADDLARALGDVPALAAELETTITRQKGIDYAARGASRAAESPLLPEQAASRARHHLRGVLVSWVRWSAQNGIRHASPDPGLPDTTLEGMSRWLLWRVDGLTLHDEATNVHHQLTEAVRACWKRVDRRPDETYIGRCGADTGDGDACSDDLYARAGATTTTCRTCHTTWDVHQRRNYLLAEAEEVLATAAEISRAVSWLGAEPLTADRVRQWATRGRITARGHDRQQRPLYRVGDAIDLLARTTQKDGAA